MRLRSGAAPAHPCRGCTGAFVFLLALLHAGCENSPLRREVKLDIGGDTVTLAKGVRVRDIAVGGPTQQEFAPLTVEADTGDVIRFTTSDARTHLIEFDISIPPAAQQLFASKSQMRSPPLVQKGAVWIVTLEGVPPGEYRYRCTLHGTVGLITVRA